MKRLTTTRSRDLDKTDVIDIGLKSAGVFGDLIFANGRMEADFHCVGTVESFRV